MDNDEALFLIVASVLGIAVLVRWYSMLIRMDHSLGGIQTRALFALLPVVCIAGVWLVLISWADTQVSQAPEYLFMFTAAAAMWLWVPMLALPILGISSRSDALERANGPAAIVCAAGLAATTVVYAASNVGTGPTIWTTIQPAMLGTAIMVVAWFVHRLLSPAWEDVAVGRDPAAGVRLGTFLLATAIVIAPPLAGNWVSEAASWNDLVRRAWPVLALVAIAAFIDRPLTPTSLRPIPAIASAGILPGKLWLFIATLTAVALR